MLCVRTDDQAAGCQYRVECDDLYTRPSCPGPTWRPLTKCEGDFLRQHFVIQTFNIQDLLKACVHWLLLPAGSTRHRWPARSAWTSGSAGNRRSISPSASQTTSSSSSAQTASTEQGGRSSVRARLKYNFYLEGSTAQSLASLLTSQSCLPKCRSVKRISMRTARMTLMTRTTRRMKGMKICID